MHGEEEKLQTGAAWVLQHITLDIVTSQELQMASAQWHFASPRAHYWCVVGKAVHCSFSQTVHGFCTSVYKIRLARQERAEAPVFHVRCIIHRVATARPARSHAAPGRPHHCLLGERGANAPEASSMVFLRAVSLATLWLSRRSLSCAFCSILLTKTTLRLALRSFFT